MPVLITIATVNALFRPGSDEVGFLNPDKLRARCMEELEDTETRHRAIMLTDELQRLARQYEKAVVASVNAYTVESVKWESSANGLIEQLQPWDSTRISTIQGIVRVRQSMRELLTAEQWQRVFE
jgi:hypothetical protein